MISRVVCSLVTSIAIAQICHGWTFKNEKYGYSLEIPFGWEQISASVLSDQIASKVPNVPVIFDAGFQPEESELEFGFPRIVVAVLPNKNLGIFRQLSVTEQAEIAAKFAGISPQELQDILDEKVADKHRNDMSLQRTWNPVFDKANHRMNWKIEANTLGVPVVGYSTIMFGKEASVILGCWDRLDAEPSIEPLASRISSSLKFDSLRAYNPLAIAPVIRRPRKSPLEAGLVGALTVLIVGGFSYAFSKFKAIAFPPSTKTASFNPTNTGENQTVPPPGPPVDKSFARAICPRCTSRFTAPATAAGKKTKCPKCAAVITIQLNDK